MQEQKPTNSIDAYAPAEVAAMVEKAGVSKAALSIQKTLILALLAGAFIAFGGMFFTVAITDTGMGFGPTRLLGGAAFSLGLILVVVAGAELFTGNNLIVMAWASRRITTARLLRNWLLVYIGNLVGALAMALMVYWSGVLEIGDGAVAAKARDIAGAKIQLPFVEAFLRGVLCNTLVCLAVWLCVAAHSVVSKILAILFPITAFVALGFEHSVANMYLIPVGYLAGAEGVSVTTFIANIVPVTLGNVVGGSVLVAFVYWVAYLRNNEPAAG
jgi:formate/nitrite transporter